jgi:two-component system, NtrC family, response regulator HydG
VIKPFKHKVLLQLLRDLLGDSPRAAADAEGECLIAESEAMQRLMTLARRAASTQAPALITGESGVGKGALARMLHEQSPRRAAPLVQVNCAALSPAHAEATLFGVDSERPGQLMRAHGGTLLLDEIAELGVALQPRLLEVLESGRLHGQPLDIRLLAATNRDLDEAVAAGLFRAELLWRLRVVHLHIPPLRERATDLPSIAAQLLAQHAPRLGHRALTLSEDAQQALLRYDWPGNIRELDNLLYRAAILCKQSTIEARDLGLPSERWITSPAAPGAVSAGDEEFPSLPELERQHIQRALELAQGNKSQAARLLGIHRKTLYRKLEEQGISVDED